MSGGWTKGPWRQKRDVWDTLIFGENRPALPLASVHKGARISEERDANARLIAAAPDLYEALERTHAIIVQFTQSGFTDREVGMALYENQGKIFSALRKAREGQSNG